MTKQSLLGSVSALVLSLLLFSSSVSGDYSRPTAYSVDCVLSLPYGQIVQNIADYYDATEETDTKQTLDYFHGTDIYTFRYAYALRSGNVHSFLEFVNGS